MLKTILVLYKSTDSCL